MRTSVSIIGLLALALILPACGKKKQGPATIDLPFPVYTSDAITVDAQNNDAVDYNLSIREFTGGVESAQIDLLWPVFAAAGGFPGHREANWSLTSDSAVYTHSVVIFDQVGLLVDQKPFVKGSAPLLLMVTITSGVMTVQTSP